MLIRLNLNNVLVRRAIILITLLTLGWLIKIIIGEFVAGTLSDKRININKNLLASSVEYLPASAQLFARLGEYEATELKADFESAEKHIQQAVNLSPNNFKYRLLLAKVRDFRGDQAGANQSFNDALELAPNYSDVHWRFANFLVRQKRIEESVEHFRIAAALNPALFAGTLDLMWAVSDKNIIFLNRIVQDNQKGQLKLALLLANQSRISEAAEIFSKIDRTVLLSAWESSTFFDLLTNKGFPKLANDLWNKLRSVDGESVNSSLIWNGDFESESNANLTQFDWRVGKSEFARIGIDNSKAHSGTHSLRFDFLGRDTAKLDNEVKHLIVLRPDANCRLEFYVKTEELKTDEGPRIVISDKSGNRIAQSEPVSSGTNDWKRIFVNFIVPKKTAGDAAALVISVKRQPRYMYNEPTSGRIWFDDFSAIEVSGK